MPTPTYIPIASTTLSSTTTSVTFSAIPTTFMDLVLVANVTTSVDAATSLFGNRWAVQRGGTDAFSASDNTGSVSAMPTKSSERALGIFQIIGYSRTNQRKVAHLRNGFGSSGNNEFWSLTDENNFNAITSLTLTTNAGTYSVGSTFNLYGIVG